MIVKNLSYDYKTGFSIKNINFQVKEAEILGVLGSNGSGKTTLIKNIIGIKEGGGEVFFKGKDLKMLNLVKKRRKIAYVPQESQVNNLTVYETIMLGRIPYIKYNETMEDKKIVDELIMKFNLQNYRGRKISSLSGGEKQRAYIARALAQNSEIIVMDEPTSNLDLSNAFNILKIIKEVIKENKMRCLIIIHDLSLIGRFCDKLLLLKNGRQLHFGDKESTFKSEILENLYEVRVKVTKINEEYFISPQE